MSIFAAGAAILLAAAAAIAGVLFKIAYKEIHWPQERIRKQAAPAVKHDEEKLQHV